MSQPAETWCKVSFVDLVVPLLVRALVIQAKKSKSTKATTVSFNEVVGFLCFFGGKLGVKEENKNWFTSLNMTMPPKERPFQKDISSYSHYFSGDMLVFWRVDEALKHVFFEGNKHVRIIESNAEIYQIPWQPWHSNLCSILSLNQTASLPLSFLVRRWNFPLGTQQMFRCELRTFQGGHWFLHWVEHL